MKPKAPKMTPKAAPPPAMPMGQAMRDNKMPAMPGKGAFPGAAPPFTGPKKKK